MSTARGEMLATAYEWVMYQIRCSPHKARRQCGLLYRPTTDMDGWNPARHCRLRRDHPDDCATANFHYAFGLRDTGMIPLTDLYALAYQLKDHGLKPCPELMRNCELERHALRIVGRVRRTWPEHRS